MPKFIVFEGLDGSGKSEIAKCVALKLNAVLLKSPSEVIEPIRTIVNESGDLIFRSHYYIIGNMLVSHQAQKALTEGKNVVCDRYVDSTFVYIKFFGHQMDEAVWETRCLTPDIKIFLDVSRDERIRRLRMRNCSHDKEDKMTEIEENNRRIREFYLQRQEFIVVDTDQFHDKIESEVDFIMSLIEEL